MPLYQLKSNMEREISCLLPTLPKLNPLQSSTPSLSTLISRTHKQVGINREHGQEMTPQGPAGSWHQSIQELP